MSETELREALERCERRITELEIEAAFRRQAHDDLDEVIRDQNRRIDRLERRLDEVLGQLTPAAD
jgi:uncharacterized coiled-coil protein SlyX